MMIQNNKIKKIPKGTTVRIVKDVIRIVPGTHTIRTKVGSSFNTVGYFYSMKGGLCPICQQQWYNCMDLYVGEDFTVQEIGRNGPNYVYQLQTKSGRCLSGFLDGRNALDQALTFCQHWIKPVKTVATAGSRLNFVMGINNEPKQVVEQHITNGIDY